MISPASLLALLGNTIDTADEILSQAIIDARVSGLIGRFYEAAADDALWAGIAADVSETLDSTSAVLKLHGADDDVRLLEHTENLRVANEKQSWAAHWHQKDLWVERSARFGVSRIVTDHDLVSPAEQRKSGFYQEWLFPRYIPHGRCGVSRRRRGAGRSRRPSAGTSRRICRQGSA